MIMEEVIESIIGALFGKKEREFVARGGDIKIGDGIIQLWEQTMPLDAVSMLDVTQLAPIPYIKPIVVLTISILLIIMVPDVRSLFCVIGIMAIGVLVFYHIWNQNRLYFLDIYNHMGYRIRLQHWNKGFLIDLKEQIEKCLKNKNMNMVIHLSNDRFDINVGDIVTGNAHKYQAGGDIIEEGGVKNRLSNIITGNNNDVIQNAGNHINGNGNIVTGNGNSATVNQEINMRSFNQAGISDAEWKQILEFAITRKKDYARDNIYYLTCNNMQYSAQKKDMKKLAYWVKYAGKAVMDTVLSTCTSEAVKKIINDILCAG